MAVPKFYEFILPMLKHLSDGQEKNIQTLTELIAKELTLSDEDRKKRVPSGTQTLLSNRASWALSYLKKAGLIAT